MSLRANVRVLFVLLMCAVICVHGVALVSQHVHDHASHDFCGLCHVGSMTFVHSVISTTFVPVLAVTWLERSSEPRATTGVLRSAGPSRAPPA